MNKNIKKDTTQIVCVARFVAKEDKLDELLQELYALIEPTRKEEGCIRYELNQSVDDPKVMTFVEKFKDKAAIESHGNMPYIINLVDNIIPNLVASSSITFHNEII